MPLPSNGERPSSIASYPTVSCFKECRPIGFKGPVPAATHASHNDNTVFIGGVDLISPKGLLPEINYVPRPDPRRDVCHDPSYKLCAVQNFYFLKGQM
jgi:hypothetical protein